MTMKDPLHPANAPVVFPLSATLSEEVKLLREKAGKYYKQGRYADALQLYERALTIRENALGPDHTDVAQAQGRYSAVLPLHERALAIRTKALGPDHPDVASSLNNIANLYYTQATISILQTVELGLNNIADPDYAQDLYADALSLYERALAIWEKALGPAHPAVATGLNNIANLHHAQGRYATALPLYERALVIREKALGPEHPWVATSRSSLSNCLQKLGESKTSD